ncbi:MAG: hypothetical protein RR957_03295 [Oscillospiraceae bacterium]
MKRILIPLILIMMILLTGCGKKAETHLGNGFSFMEKGQYEQALDEYKKAGELDKKNTETQEIIKIIDTYKKALEAYNLGDSNGAIAFLRGIPPTYTNYPIKKDINELFSKTKSTPPVEPSKEAATTQPPTTQNPVQTASPLPSSTPSATSKGKDLDAELNAVQEKLNAGDYVGAMDLLSVIDDSKGTPAQRQKAAELSKNLDAKLNGKTTSESFTAEEACEIVNDKYGVKGDASGFEPKTSESGEKYYELIFQHDESDSLVEVEVYSDGRVNEIKRTPLSVG